MSNQDPFSPSDATTEQVVQAPVPTQAPPTQALAKSFSGVIRTSFKDRESAKSDQIPSLKFKQDEIARISILDDGLMLVGRAHNHFIEGDKTGASLGYVNCRSVFKRSGDAEVPVQLALCCQLLPEPRKRIATLVLRYATDRVGNYTKPLEFTCLTWVFGPDKFEDLDLFQQQGYNLAETDFIVSCEDSKFQKIKFVVPRDAGIRDPKHPKNAEFVSRFGQQIKDYVTTMEARLARVIGRDVTDEDLVKKLGPGAATQSHVPSIAPMTVPTEVSDLFG